MATHDQAEDDPTLTGAFKDHFSTKAADYATFRPVYPPELASYLASLTSGHELVLDCGCGTGQLSVLLADVFNRVVATDASAEQIANAKPHPKIEYKTAKAEASGLPHASVDLVTVAQAAHWFDLDAFYAEVRRVLRPKGAIILISYGVLEIDGEVRKILGSFYRQTLDEFWPPERRHVENGYRDFSFPFNESRPPQIAIRTSWDCERLLGYVDTWSAVRNLEKAQGREPFNVFAAQLKAAWGDPHTEREMRWPLAMRVGHVS